ncbi:autotransporter outer membrane beta-barrel domain-containing protein [Chryseobacterium oryzae]|uniref:Right handed beta helix region n=1 Tax=Chryseobacterium oryzae TaxID=2929799 RepID=A0ABY4BFZ9_9FLAO|nr:hypothetical protein [Chryseobacterium oryzae]UOE37980.1 hypothetical protein MTP08_13135 [Chryseobacterium oryzae]
MIKNLNLSKHLLVFLLLCLFSAKVYSQTNYYVKSGATGSGSSWDDALGNLPTISGGAINNVHIYVAEGDYNFASTSAYSYTGNDVLIQGGFPANATGTDLSGYNPEANVSRIVKDSNFRFVRINSTSNAFNTNKFTLKGLYFKSTGSTATDGSIFYDSNSNGNYQFKLEDCQIHDSKGATGLFSLFSAYTGKKTFWFNNNKFYRNQMGATGPIVFSTVNGDVKVLLSGNLFGQGNSTDGTGFYATTAGNTTSSQARFYIIGNIFSCGTATSTTGGVYLTTAGNTVVKNNVFLGVSGANFGGAIFATAQRGLQIESNYFIQNYVKNSTDGYGGAISIEGSVQTGSIINSNYIKNNFFFGNKINGSGGAGSAISLAASPAAINASYDIDGNVFAYNTALQGKQAAIQTRADNIGNIRNNIFYGNQNSGGTADPFAEIRGNSASNFAGVIDNNKFQLASAANYIGNTEAYSKIAAGTGNTFGTTSASIENLKPDDYIIDCYTGSVGCYKIDESSAAVSKTSRIGVSTFSSQNSNWPQKDLDGNDINNGIMVLSSNSKPFVVTRVANPTKTLGTNSQLKGAIAYDTQKKCLMLFDGEKWDCIAKGCDKSIYDVLQSIKSKP